MFYRCILHDNITALLTITHCVAYKSELQHCIHVCNSSFFACLCLCFGGLHCAPECTAYFYWHVLHLVFAGNYRSPWHGTDRKWEGGGWGAPPHFFFELIVFFLVGFVGPMFGYFRDACTLSIFGWLMPVWFGWSVFILCLLFNDVECTAFW